MTEKPAADRYPNPSQAEVDTYVGTLLSMLNESNQREASARARVITLTARIKTLEGDTTKPTPAPAPDPAVS